MSSARQGGDAEPPGLCPAQGCPHLADAIDAEVAAAVAVVAGGPIHHRIPQLLRKVLVLGPAVQLTGVHWGTGTASAPLPEHKPIPEPSHGVKHKM